jgi:hypothetical protein
MIECRCSFDGLVCAVSYHEGGHLTEKMYLKNCWICGRSALLCCMTGRESAVNCYVST